jgi:hypothetical protein
MSVAGSMPSTQPLHPSLPCNSPSRRHSNPQQSHRREFCSSEESPLREARMYERTNPASLDSTSDDTVPVSGTLKVIETQSQRYGQTHAELPRFFRIESPRISMRCALCTNRSRMPSASGDRRHRLLPGVLFHLAQNAFIRTDCAFRFVADLPRRGAGFHGRIIGYCRRRLRVSPPTC